MTKELKELEKILKENPDIKLIPYTAEISLEGLNVIVKKKGRGRPLKVCPHGILGKSKCKECLRQRGREYQRKNRQRNPEKYRAYRREYYRKNIDRMRKYQRNYYRKRRNNKN